MSNEIFYCSRCQTRLFGQQFLEGTAFRVRDQISCENCLGEIVAPLSLEEQQEILLQVKALKDNTSGVRRVPYRLPEVIGAQTVSICEGEKDCDNLMKLGITATCNCGGAGKWRQEYSEALRGKDVVIFGDADEPGKAHVDQVIESLTGIARSIKRVTLPDVV